MPSRPPARGRLVALAGLVALAAGLGVVATRVHPTDAARAAIVPVRSAVPSPSFETRPSAELATSPAPSASPPASASSFATVTPSAGVRAPALPPKERRAPPRLSASAPPAPAPTSSGGFLQVRE